MRALLQSRAAWLALGILAVLLCAAAPFGSYSPSLSSAGGTLTGAVTAPTYNVTAGGSLSNAGTALTLKGNAPATGGVAITIDNATTQSGGDILDLRSGGSLVGHFDQGGSYITSNQVGAGVVTSTFYIRPGTSLSTCGSGIEGAIQVKSGGSGTPTKMCYCVNFNGSGTYQWVSVNLGTGAFLSAGGSTTVCP